MSLSDIDLDSIDTSTIKGVTKAATTRAKEDASVLDKGVADFNTKQTEISDERHALTEKAKEPGSALAPPDLPKYKPPAPTDPWAVWGSPAMWFAALSGFMGRRSANRSISAAAAVLNATNQKDQATAKQAFDQWKIENENAIKMHDWQQQTYKTALEGLKEDSIEARATVETIAHATKDDPVLHALETSGMDGAREVFAQREQNARAMAEHAPQLEKWMMEKKALNDYSAAQAKFRSAQTEDQKKAAVEEGHEALKRLVATQGKAQEIEKSEALGDSAKMDEGSIAAASVGMPLNGLVRGRGKDAEAQFKELRSGAIQKIMKDTGMSEDEAGVEFAQRQIDYANDKKSEGIMTVALDRLVPAVGQLDYNSDSALIEAQKLGTTNLSPYLNVIARGEQRIEGHPEYNSLIFYLDAMTQEAAKITSGGVGSIQQLNEGARIEAQKWANQNITTDALKRLGESLKAEGNKRIELTQKQMRDRRVGGSPPKSEGDKFKEGEIYTDKSGNKAKYLGNGQWEEQ